SSRRAPAARSVQRSCPPPARASGALRRPDCRPVHRPRGTTMDERMVELLELVDPSRESGRTALWRASERLSALRELASPLQRLGPDAPVSPEDARRIEQLLAALSELCSFYGRYRSELGAAYHQEWDPLTRSVREW